MVIKSFGGTQFGGLREKWESCVTRDFKETDFEGVINWTERDFEGVNWTEQDFEGVNWTERDFEGVKWTERDFEGVNWTERDFEGVN